MSYVVPEGRGYRDSDIEIATAQAIPLDGAADDAENVINLGNAAPNLGASGRVRVQVEVTTAFGVSANTPTLAIAVVTDDNASLSSDSAIATVLTLNSDAAKGDIFEASIPRITENAFEQYVGATLTPSSTEFTAGAVDIRLIID